MCGSDINFTLVRAVDLTFVYRGHRCKDFCYSWQKMKRQHCSQLNKNLPSWAADRIAAVSCITNPVHQGEKKDKRMKNHIQNFNLIIGPGCVMKKRCLQLNSTGVDGVLALIKEPNCRSWLQLVIMSVEWVPAKVAMRETSERTERLCVVIERRGNRSCWTGPLNQTTICSIRLATILKTASSVKILLILHLSLPYCDVTLV